MAKHYLHILVVDDAPTMRKIVTSILSQLSFDSSLIVEAGHGKEALEKLNERLEESKKSGGQKHFDLIISDWNMEPMTGLELLIEVRKHEGHKHLPFLLVTAESKTENVVAAKKAGASNYIVKPFTAETLTTKLKQMKILAP